MNGKKTAVVIGGGVGGLSAGVRLAARGMDVTVLERAARPGGKLRQVQAGAGLLDAGPTVFTMRWVFDDLLAEAGTRLDDRISATKADILARHGWLDGSRLDLFADMDRSARAIREFAGRREALGYRMFCDETRDLFRLLKEPFLRQPAPELKAMIKGFGLSSLSAMQKMQPFNTMWRGIAKHFRDPRLRQLFGRYATYCGSSPYLAPATLMLVAHVEQEGVWYVDGGMYAVIEMLAGLLDETGGTLRCGAEVAEVMTRAGRAVGVRLADGEELMADAVIMNGDCQALASGLLGDGARYAVPSIRPEERSLSALTWCLEAETSDFPLIRHNVFFSSDYEREFDELVVRRRLPSEPTVYICAQDREDGGLARPGPERLFLIVNAPATADQDGPTEAEIEACDKATFDLLERCGVTLQRKPEATVRATPHTFADLFPATGGAIYGQASHGWQASLQRPGARSRIPGLYLAGGSVHPGPGVPMAALSGYTAAGSVLRDLA